MLRNLIKEKERLKSDPRQDNSVSFFASYKYPIYFQVASTQSSLF
jgi:hypothetical protein